MARSYNIISDAAGLDSNWFGYFNTELFKKDTYRKFSFFFGIDEKPSTLQVSKNDLIRTNYAKDLHE